MHAYIYINTLKHYHCHVTILMKGLLTVTSNLMLQLHEYEHSCVETITASLGVYVIILF